MFGRCSVELGRLSYFVANDCFDSHQGYFMINKLVIYLPEVSTYARRIGACPTSRYLNANAMPGNATFLDPLFQTTYFSGASGNLSITYFPLATLIIGTPGTLRILLFKSLSFVATI